jgi:DNA-binding MarR family transcriptional regulator
MDAYLSSHQNSAIIFEPPPVLIVADTESGRARARSTVMLSGFRVGDAVSIHDAGSRIRNQVSASALWVELDAAGIEIDDLLKQIAEDVGDHRYRAVVSVPGELVDAVARYAFDGDIDVIVDADDSARAAALALAIAGRNGSHAVMEASADKNAARLRQLSDEVGRIAATLARLSTGPTATARREAAETLTDAPEVSIETVRAIIRARRLRSRYFREDMFADPAWDMLLDLLQAEIAKLRVPVSSLCIAAAVPATTGLRWLKTMVQEGIFVRRADPHDGRRVFVELAPQTSQALRRYFAEVGKVAVI